MPELGLGITEVLEEHENRDRPSANKEKLQEIGEIGADTIHILPKTIVATLRMTTMPQ